MKRRIEVFLISYIVWLLIAWPHGEAAGGWDVQVLLLGIGVSLLITLVFGKGFAEKPAKLLSPKRWMYLLIFIPVFAYYCVKANLQVAYMVLHPDMPIQPGIVRVRTGLRSKAAITALANCITLTPGTLTVDATDEGVLFVHWIEVRTTDDEEAGAVIVRRFENFLKKIIEDA